MRPQFEQSYRSLSPDELKFLWQGAGIEGKSPRVVEYDDVMKASSIDSLFGDDNCLILFYPNHSTGNQVSGHYVTLIRHIPKNPRHKPTIYFYDPYGIKPDTQKKFSRDQREMLYKEEENTLIRLMLQSGYNVDYSDHKHQSTIPGVATCGRHSLNRCKYWFLTNDQYDQLLKHGVKKSGLKNNDDYVVSKWS